MVQKIVLPLDLDEESSWRKALPTAIDLARHSGAEFHVMTVVPDEHFKMMIVAQLLPEGYEQRMIDDAKQRLAALLKEHAPGHYEPPRAIRPHPRLQQLLKEILHILSCRRHGWDQQ